MLLTSAHDRVERPWSTAWNRYHQDSVLKLSVGSFCSLLWKTRSNENLGNVGNVGNRIYHHLPSFTPYSVNQMSNIPWSLLLSAMCDRQRRFWLNSKQLLAPLLLRLTHLRRCVVDVVFSWECRRYPERFVTCWGQVLAWNRTKHVVNFD